MRSLVNLLFLVCLVYADVSTKQDVKTKQIFTTNSLQTVPKQEQTYLQPLQYQQIYYQGQGQGQGQNQVGQGQYIQVIPKPIYVPQQQQQQPTMIIIAQPAFVPANVLYGGGAQQLLHYIQQSNPQPRYQVVHQIPQPKYVPQATVIPTNYQVVTPNHYQTHSPVPTSPATHEIYTPNYSQNNYNPQPNHYALQQQQQQPQQQSQPQQPVQLNQIAHLAQIAAQQYLTSPTKTAPAIFTGFENFTPEQQAQIKSQLSQHFGQLNDISGEQPTTKSQYSSRVQSSDFVPSAPVKNEPSAPGITSTIQNKQKYKM